MTNLEDFSAEQWFSSIHCPKAAYLSAEFDAKAFRKLWNERPNRVPYSTNRLIALRQFWQYLKDKNIEITRRFKTANGKYLAVDGVADQKGKRTYYIFIGIKKSSAHQVASYILKEAQTIARLSRVMQMPDEYIVVWLKPEKRDNSLRFHEENITNRMQNMLSKIAPQYQEKIRKFLALAGDRPPVKMGEHCREASFSNPCPYIPVCQEGTSNIPIRNLKNLRFQTKRLIRGYNINQRAQIPTTYGLTDKETLIIREDGYLNMPKLADFINENIADHPLAFMDFEAFKYPYPLLPNIHPDNYTTFQYSVHLLKSWKSEPIHIEFLALNSDQPTEDFAASIVPLLKKLIREKYKIIVYNKTFELQRLGEIPYFQTGKGEAMLNTLKGVNGKELVVDLYEPFRKQWYYSPIQKGSMGLKAVYKSFITCQTDAIKYEDLAIQNGLEAAEAYQIAQVIRKRGRTQSHRFLKIRENLLEYCKLDTWAMYVIIKELRKMIPSAQ